MTTVAPGQEWRHRSGGEIVEVVDEVEAEVTTWRVRRTDNGEESNLVEGSLLAEYRLVDGPADSGS